MIELTQREGLELYTIIMKYITSLDKECLKKRCTHDIALIEQSRKIDKELEPMREIADKLWMKIVHSAGK